MLKRVFRLGLALLMAVLVIAMDIPDAQAINLREETAVQDTLKTRTHINSKSSKAKKKKNDFKENIVALFISICIAIGMILLRNKVKRCCVTT